LHLANVPATVSTVAFGFLEGEAVAIFTVSSSSPTSQTHNRVDNDISATSRNEHTYRSPIVKIDR
jgi:hypothetical protein